MLSFSYKEIYNIIGETSLILKKSFYPDVFLAIGSGGLIPARMLKNFIDRPIITVTLKRYHKGNQPLPNIKVYQWLDDNALIYIENKKVLIIDDIDDTRETLLFCVKKLLTNAKPSELSVFIIFTKRKTKCVQAIPKINRMFYGREVEDVWIKFPWEV